MVEARCREVRSWVETSRVIPATEDRPARGKRRLLVGAFDPAKGSSRIRMSRLLRERAGQEDSLLLAAR